MNKIDFIKQEEGKCNYAYKDSLGYLTIGYGRLIAKERGGRITDEECIYLLNNDIKEKEKDLDKNLPWWRKLNEVRQTCLLSMCFQLGITTLLKFKNTLKFIENGEYLNASKAMKISKAAKQTPQRWNRQAKMMELGKWVD